MPALSCTWRRRSAATNRAGCTNPRATLTLCNTVLPHSGGLTCDHGSMAQKSRNHEEKIMIYCIPEEYAQAAYEAFTQGHRETSLGLVTEVQPWFANRQDGHRIVALIVRIF